MEYNISKKNPSTDLKELSSFYLSYMGDAIFELWCRQRILDRFQNRKIVHNYVVQLVRCQTQARIATIILPILTSEEKKIFYRGRNGKVISIPGHATVKEYRKANGFECLVGYLFVKKETERFEQLMNNSDVFDHIESLIK